MTDWRTIDFFTDPGLIDDPYEYFETLREECPVLELPHLGVVAVTGYDEINEVYRNTEDFSSCNSVAGPWAVFPVPLEGDDVTDLINEHRGSVPMSEYLMTLDPPDHTRERALLMRLITPKRLKDNEAFLWRLADEQLDEFVGDGRCEFMRAFAQPLAMLVIADLLGVPEEDFDTFRTYFGLNDAPSALATSERTDTSEVSIATLDEWFARYVADRRANPRKDVLTDLALAVYPDGAMPDIPAVVRTATLLFAAGQETSARLLTSGLRYLAEQPELQDELRDHPDRIPGFIEEALRLESPIKADFRMSRRKVNVAGVEIAPGTPVMLLNGAANRDPRRFDCPAELQVERANAQAHLAFGRGIHSCPGGPLARAEGRISVERILARTRNIRLSEEHHGPVGERRFTYDPVFLLRGLTELHLEWDPFQG